MNNAARILSRIHIKKRAASSNAWVKTMGTGEYTASCPTTGIEQWLLPLPEIVTFDPRVQRGGPQPPLQSAKTNNKLGAILDEFLSMSYKQTY